MKKYKYAYRCHYCNNICLYIKEYPSVSEFIKPEYFRHFNYKKLDNSSTAGFNCYFCNSTIIRLRSSNIIER